MKKVRPIKYFSLSIIFMLFAFLSCMLFASNKAKAGTNFVITSTNVYWDGNNNVITDIVFANSNLPEEYYLYIYKDTTIQNINISNTISENATMSDFITQHPNYVYRATTNETYYKNNSILWSSFIQYDETTHSSLGLVYSDDIPEGRYYCVLFVGNWPNYYLAGYCGSVGVGSGTNPEHYDYTYSLKLSVHNYSGANIYDNATLSSVYKNIDTGAFYFSGSVDYVNMMWGQTYPNISSLLTQLQNNAPTGKVFDGLYTASTSKIIGKIQLNATLYSDELEMTVINGFLVKYYDKDLNPLGTYTGETDVVLYPKYIDEGFTVKYDNNGGTGTMEDSFYSIGQVANLSNCTFERIGYKFLGWSTDKDATEKDYSNQASVDLLNGTADQTITLYAIWEMEYYCLAIFYENGQGNSFAMYPYNYQIEPIEDPTRNGYVFKGWDVAIPTTMPAHDVVITAQWAKVAKIKFYKDINSSPLAEYEFECGSILPSITPPEAPTKEGYEFGGWDQAIPTTMPNNDLNIVAVFNKIYTFKIVANINNTENIIFTFTGIKNSEIEYGSYALPTYTGYRENGYDGSLPVYMPSYDLTIHALYNKLYTLNVYKEYDGELLFTFTGIKDEAIDHSSVTEPTKQGCEFTGWSSTIPDKMPENDLNIYGQWNDIAWLRFYYEDGKTLIKEFKLEPGDALANIEKPAPSKLGYKFMGWDKTIPAYMPLNDLSFIAVFEKIYELNIYFEEGGDLIFSFKGIKGTTISYSSLYTPSKEGYNFNGWSSDLPSTMPENGLDIYAQWKIGMYTIAFKAGMEIISPIKQEYGTPITAPTDPIYPGYIFLGWSPSIPSTMPGQNMVITAVFEKLDHIVTIKLNNGSDDLIYTIGHNFVAPKVDEPKREHYHFTGWDKELPNLITEDITINATWEINKHTIKFVDCQEGADVSVEYNYGDTIVVPSYSKKAYDFISWSDTIPSTMPDEDVTITAMWIAHKYKVIYNVDGGSAIATQEYAYKAKTTLPQNPTKTGYTFVSWDKELPSIMPDNDITLKAIWKINTYKVTYKVDGNVYNEINYDFNTKLSKQETPTKEGYKFIGWDKEIPTNMPANDLEFNAQYEILTLTVTFFDANGDIYNKQTIEYNQKVSLISPPTKEYYTFVNWYTDVNDENSTFDFTKQIKSSVNVYPVFKELDKFESISQTVNNCEVLVSSPNGLYNDTKLEVKIIQNEDIMDPEVAKEFIVDYSKYLTDESLIGCIYDVKLMRDGAEYRRDNLIITLDVPKNLQNYKLYLYHFVTEENWEYIEHFDYKDGKITLNVNDLQQFAIFYYRDGIIDEPTIDYIPYIIAGAVAVVIVIGVSIGIGVAVKRKRQRDAFDW